MAQNSLLNLLILHGIGPLFYHALHNNGNLDKVADHVVKRLQQLYLQSAGLSQLREMQVSALAKAFLEAEVRVIWTKGIVLASAVYSDPVLRPMGDIDLILRKEDLDRAERVLQALGFVRTDVEPFGSFTKDVAHARVYSRSDKRGLPLEIHHALVKDHHAPSLIGSAWFWEHTTSTSINGDSIVSLNNEAFLLHLCAHLASHHGWDPRFIWLYDIHALIEKYKSSFDWRRFGQLIEMAHVEPYAYHVLRASRVFLCTPVPEKVLLKLGKADRKSVLLNWQMSLPPTRALRSLADWWRLPDLRTRARFLWHTIFPTREYMLNRYQPPNHHLWPLLYPYRWGIMLRDVKKTIGALCRQQINR